MVATLEAGQLGQWSVRLPAAGGRGHFAWLLTASLGRHLGGSKTRPITQKGKVVPKSLSIVSVFSFFSKIFLAKSLSNTILLCAQHFKKLRYN